jgi:hypothetical protein
MSDKTAKINTAIRDCLARCYESEAPLAELAEYVILLRAEPAWSDAEIYEVETTVRRVLMGIVRGHCDDTLSL